MKKKPAGKAKAKSAGASKNEAAVAPSTVTYQSQPILTEGPFGEVVAMPDPRELLIEAEQEVNYRDLSEYLQVIRTLRNKSFSYRDIAAWLTERGVEVDHNAVYRVYTNSLSDQEAAYEAEREEEEARDEALRNA